MVLRHDDSLGINTSDPIVLEWNGFVRRNAAGQPAVNTAGFAVIASCGSTTTAFGSATAWERRITDTFCCSSSCMLYCAGTCPYVPSHAFHRLIVLPNLIFLASSSLVTERRELLLCAMRFPLLNA